MVLINLPHSLSTVRRYATVKEVRLQCSGWLEQSSPCPAAVWESSRLSCRGYGRRAVEVLLPRWTGVRRPSPDGVGRVGTYVRGPDGSGESELASEALRGRVSRNLRPRP